MINKEVSDQESAPNNADITSNENGDTIINRECAVGQSDVGFEGPSLKTSSRVSIITKYEEAVLKNRRDDADNDVSTLANSSSSSALGELLYCRTALSGASASIPFHPEAQHRQISSSVKKGTLFYVNSCYPGEMSQLPSTWNSLSSSAEPKSKSVEDKEGEDRKTLEETKGLSGNEEIPDTIPYIPVPSIIVPQEGMSQDSKETAAATTGEKGRKSDDFDGDKGNSLHHSRGSRKDYEDNNEDTHSSKK